MNNNYFYEYVDLLERVLSFAHVKEIYLESVEKAISHNEFFQSLEKSEEGLSPIITENRLISILYPENKLSIADVPVFNICLWAAESYMWILQKTNLTFEAIFLYLPIEEMYQRFPIYHEMDFSQIVSYFKKKQKEKSILKVLIEKYGYSINQVSSTTGVNKDTLYSIKERRRDIKNLNVLDAYKLSTFFGVRIETLTELE